MTEVRNAPMTRVLPDRERMFLAELWRISTELHDYVAARFRDGASYDDIRSEIQRAAQCRL